MGNEDDAKSAKSERSSSPLTAEQTNHNNQTNVHVYPDWTAMQAYYGPRVALPPYYNSAVASGHPPHPYMWGPAQHMMPPYGAPYAAIYPNGSVYAHPAVPLGSHGQGVPSSPPVATPLNVETPTKSSGNTDNGLMKKLKGFDALAMSIGSGAEGGAEQSLSQSSGTEGSSDGSAGNTSGVNQNGRKRSREGTPPTAGNGKTALQFGPASAKEVKAASNQVLCPSVAAASVPGTLLGTVVPQGMTTALEIKNSPNLNANSSPTSGPQPSAVIPPEAWLQNDREVKRERRKQSNRESARRSRLRKQAETEELAQKVDGLSAENAALKSELNRLTEKSGTLKLENAQLMDKLKAARGGGRTENLLSRVDSSLSIARDADKEGDMYEKNSGAKLQQLLGASPRADAVAAG